MLLAITLAVGALTMESLDGQPVVMDNYADRSATVVLFMSSRCPITQESIDAINAQYEKTRYDEVLFIGLIANDDESAQEIITFCQGRAVRFPVYRDRGGAIAKKWGITKTPQAVLLNQEGEVVYHGGFSPEAAAADFGAAIDHFIGKRPQPHIAFEAQGTPLGEANTPFVDDNRYGMVAFSSELIFEKIPNVPVHHCSTITEAANGDLIVQWYGGSYESADDQALYMSRQPKGSRDWTTPELLLKGDHLHPPGNAVLFRITGGERLGLLWAQMDGSRPVRRGGGWDQCQVFYRYSDDHGYTWTADQKMEGLFGCTPRNASMTLQDGTFTIPMSGESEGKSGGFMLMTRDNGVTWTESGVIEGGSQPTIIQRKDGSLLALLRSYPVILQSESTDLGQTWTKPEKTELRCPGSGIAMTQLDNGHLVLVYNNSPNWDRNPLNVIRSLDEGKTWTEDCIIEPNWSEYSYPSVIQSSDGKIHLTYTYRRYSIKHVTFNEDWMYQLLRPN